MTTSTKAPASTSLVDALIDIGTLVDRAFEVRLRELKLSTAQLRILEALDVGGRLQPKTLAALLIQEPHSVSGLLNRLEDRGLIDRTRDRADRRVVWIALTVGGASDVAQAAQERKVLEALAQDELGMITDGVVEIANRWREALRRLMSS